MLVAGRRERGRDVRAQEGVEEEGDPEEASADGQRVGARVAGLTGVAGVDGLAALADPPRLASGSRRTRDPSSIGNEHCPEDLAEQHGHEERGERQSPTTDLPPGRHQQEK